jgi:hypothetical protein
MTVTDDRETIVGRSCYRQTQLYLATSAALYIEQQITEVSTARPCLKVPDQIIPCAFHAEASRVETALIPPFTTAGGGFMTSLIPAVLPQLHCCTDPSHILKQEGLRLPLAVPHHSRLCSFKWTQCS